jgi:protein SMG6
MFIDNQLDNNWRSIVQENAVQLGLDMFALLAGRCTALLRSLAISDNKNSSGGSTVEFYQYRLNEIPPATVAELRAFLPGMKVWSDWMTCHVHLWNPPPIPLEPELWCSIRLVKWVRVKRVR